MSSLTTSEREALQREIDDLRKQVAELQFPPVGSPFEEVSGVHASYSKSGRLLQIELHSSKSAIMKLARGGWMVLTFREKLKLVSIIFGLLTGSSGLGAFLHGHLYPLVCHGR